METAAEWLAAAERPLIIAANGGRDAAGYAALDAFAERFAIPVAQHKPRYLSLRSSHPMNVGYDPTGLVADADLIIVIESDAPWFPAQAQPPSFCKVIQCGFDPLFTRIPIRGFPCDLGLVGSTAAILSGVTQALARRADEARIDRRRDAVAQKRAPMMAQCEATLEGADQRAPLHPAWVSRCVSEAKDPDAIVINEYTLLLEHCSFEQPDCYFGSSAASGLGWGAGAVLGAKLAAPGRQAIAVLGDGAYLFSNPVSVHHASAMHNLPVLFVVMNNSMWGAVRSSALAMYPDGWASKSNDLPFTSLGPLPALEQICIAAGGYGERVEDPAVLPAAFHRALHAVKNERRQAILNVICGIE